MDDNNEQTTDNVLQEHLWFTATTLGANVLLMSGSAQTNFHWLARMVSVILSLFAVYLILERSAGKAKKVKYPEGLLEKEDKSWRDKRCETWARWKAMPEHSRWVLFECSGSLFYSLLVVGSCVAVWLSGPKCP